MRFSKKAACVIFVGTLMFASSAPCDSLNGLFDKANNSFWNGDYAAAVELYEKIEDLGARDAVLSYNLATAYARMGKLGESARHYERALRLDPGNTDAMHNLSVLREFLARRASEAGRNADLAPAVSPWRAVLDRFSPRSAALGCLVFHLTLFFLLIVRRFVSKELPRLSLGVLAGVMAILTAITLSIAIGKWHQENYVKEAVILKAGVAEVMEGPASAVKRFSIEEGSRVRILEDKGEWTRLLDSEGRDGWVRSNEIGAI